jgi:hypothetical protein
METRTPTAGYESMKQDENNRPNDEKRNETANE